MNSARPGSLILDIQGQSLTLEDEELLKHPLTGGLILFSRNYESVDQICDLTRQIRAVNPDLLITVDHEGGRVQRFRDVFSQLPSAASVRRVYETSREQGQHLAYQIGWLIGAELGAVGVDLSYTPVLDMDYGVSEVIGDRSSGSDAETVVALAGSLIKGLSEWGFKPVGKHFPGHGYVVADSHHELPVDSRSESQILKQDIQPFMQLQKSGLGAVMSAHVVYEKVDSLPATFSRQWMTTILRHHLQFDGLVFSDDLSMKATSSYGEIEERYLLAAEAGCDVMLVCNSRADVVRVLDNVAVHGNAVGLIRLKPSAQFPEWSVLQKQTGYRYFKQQVEQILE